MNTIHVSFHGISILLLAVFLHTNQPLSAQDRPSDIPQFDRNNLIFCIGTPDGFSSEFGAVDETWKNYLKVFPQPIVFRLGVDRLEAWPFIHPSRNDSWAGSRDHTFTIRFQVNRANTEPLILTLGLADSHPTEPSRVAVTINDCTLPIQAAPLGRNRLIFQPKTLGYPNQMIFSIPAGSVHTGENNLSISLQEGSFIIYDYVALGKSALPPLSRPEIEPIAELLDEPGYDFDEIVFAVRKPGIDWSGQPGHYYANFGRFAYDRSPFPGKNSYAFKAYGDGGRLCRFNPRTQQLTVLVDDPTGGVRDPHVHYSGTKILFSYRKGNDEYYHLYEINSDGTGLRQLTDGPFNDIEPTYLPDGDIVFVSSRCNRWVNCWLTEVAILYRCDGDGGNIHPISSNNEHDNTPAVLQDGRLLYTRWEYVDRSQVHYHHLWTVNPDGTGQMTYFGNMHPGIVMIDAKPILNTNGIICSFSPGHGKAEHAGKIVTIEPKKGPDDHSLVHEISAESNYRDPYPLSNDYFLVTEDSQLLLMNRWGDTQTIYKLPAIDTNRGFWIHEPVILHPRPRETVIVSRTNLKKDTGTIVLLDAHLGRNMEGVKPGEIKKLLVLESLPKPINFTGGMEPLSYGGTFTLERILGTIPVEPDGSAYAELPALRSLFFVALDQNNLSVKRMQSFVTLQPGENAGCVGCHENRGTTPSPIIPRNVIAFSRPPSQIEPIPDIPDVIDFPRDIQPIFNRHCLNCHDYAKREGRVILTADHGPYYMQSYYSLIVRDQIADGRNAPVSNYPPRAIGSSASPLMKKIDGTHHGVTITEREKTLIRLWIETGAAAAGTYAALGSGQIGAYYANELDRRDTEWPEVKKSQHTIASRCGLCHKDAMRLPDSCTDDLSLQPWIPLEPNDPRRKFSRHLVYNLSRPDKSLMLLAPLAREAGGYATAQHAVESGHPIIFKSTGDPGYQTILSAISLTKTELEKIKRFYMPGFQPRVEYVREMKRYSILSASIQPGDTIDCYATDQAYWRSLWFKPMQP